MKNVPIKRLFIIFVIVSLIAAFPLVTPYIYKVLPQKDQNPLGLSDYTQTNTSSLAIESESKRIELTKKGSQWYVAGTKKAASGPIQDVFSAMKDSVVDQIVSKNKEHRAQYGLLPKSTTKLLLDGTPGKKTVNIGSDEGGNFYASLDGSDIVYLVKGNLKNVLPTSEASWRDKTILSIESGNIGKISVNGSHDFYITNEGSGAWRLHSNNVTSDMGSTDSATLVTSVSSLSAYDFASDEEKNEFAEAPIKETIRIDDTKGANMSMLLLLAKSGDYLVQKNGSDDVYKVSAANLSALLELYKKR